MPDRVLSLAALTVLEAGPLAMPQIARACGYTHIGLRPVAATPTETHVPILDEKPVRAELHRILDGEGISVLDCEIVRLTPDIDWDRMARSIAFTHEFGSSRLLVADNDPDPARSRDSLARLAELGDTLGVTPCLEFMPWTCAPNLAAARERISGAGNAALLIDAFHLARSGGSPAEIEAGDTAVSYLQLCDIAGPVPPMDDILREARSDRLFPGEGDVDLVSLLRKFPGLPVSLEVPADRLRDAGHGPEVRARLALERAVDVLNAADARD